MTKAEKHAAYMVEWRRRQSPEWHDANKAYLRQWHDEHREESNTKRMERYRQDPKHHAEVVKRCLEKRKSDPTKAAILRQQMQHRRKRSKYQRRALIKTQLSRLLTRSEWLYLLDVWEHRCAYCAEVLFVPTQDHVIPLTKGGEHTFDNVLPCCMRCNRMKQSRDVGEFLVELHELLGCNPWAMPK